MEVLKILTDWPLSLCMIWQRQVHHDHHLASCQLGEAFPFYNKIKMWKKNAHCNEWTMAYSSACSKFLSAQLRDNLICDSQKNFLSDILQRSTFSHFSQMIYSVQFSSVTQSSLTLCDPMNHSTPGLLVHQQLLEFTQTHVHWVGDAILPSHPLSSPSPPAPNPSQHQRLFQWVSSSYQVAKVLEFQL